MAPPVLLTPATLDTTVSALSADCPKRNVALPPFGVILAHPPRSFTGPSPTSPTVTPTSSTSSNLSDNTDDTSDSDAYRTLATVRQWTGAPIRAIVPLPRRKLALPNNAPVQDDAAKSAAHAHVNATVSACHTPVGLSPCLTRATTTRFWDDVDTDSGSDKDKDEDDEDEDEDEEGGIEGHDVPSGSRYCSYESITAAEGLSAWSFEELRAECYAQSLVARGTKPPPVVQPLLAIPPAFVPRIVPRS